MTDKPRDYWLNLVGIHIFEGIVNINPMGNKPDRRILWTQFCGKALTIFFAGALFLISLSGCQPTTLPVALTPAAIQIPSQTQTATDTFQPPPSSVVTPSSIPSPTASAIPLRATSTPQPTSEVPEWLAILSKTRTLPAVALTDMFGAPGYGWWESPDGKWIVEDELLRRVSTGKSYLRVIRLDGKIEWIVDYFKSKYGVMYSVAGWSPAGNYLYISYQLGSIDGIGFSHCRTNGLLRLDLASGSITSFLNFGDEIQNCWNYAFSDPANLLAYIPPGSPNHLIILDLITGKKLSIELDVFFNDTQPIRWSSDRKQILLIATHVEMNRSGDFKINNTDALLQIKIRDAELELKEIVRYEGILSIEDWKGDQVLLNRDPGNPAWVFLSSQIMIQTTLTPTPRP